MKFRHPPELLMQVAMYNVLQNAEQQGAHFVNQLDMIIESVARAMVINVASGSHPYLLYKMLGVFGGPKNETELARMISAVVEKAEEHDRKLKEERDKAIAIATAPAEPAVKQEEPT